VEGGVVVLAANGQQGGSGYTVLIMMVVIFAAMYFLMIRPQQRRRRQVESMQSALGLGDQVVTIGGLHATVRSVGDETVLLEIAPGVTATYARGAISRVVPAPTNDEADEADESDIDEKQSDIEGSSDNERDADTSASDSPDPSRAGPKKVVKRDRPQ
jgi:preprotein translocase subunit YajC